MRAHACPGKPLWQVPRQRGGWARTVQAFSGAQAARGAKGRKVMRGAVSLVAAALPVTDPQAISAGIALVPGTCHHTSWCGFPASLTLRTSRLSKPRQEGPGRYWVTASQNNSLQNHRAFKSKGPPTCYYGGLAPGAWPHSPTLQDCAEGPPESCRLLSFSAWRSLCKRVAREELCEDFRGHGG